MFWADEIAAQAEGPQVVNDSKTPSGTIHVGSLRGVIIHDAIVRALRDAGFSGPCLIERIDGLETPEEVDRELARGREYLERTVAEVEQTAGGNGR